MRNHFLRRGLRWSEGDLRRLRELAARGELLATIAARLGRTIDAVQWQADRRGIALARNGTALRRAAGRAADYSVSAPS